ncbi:MAG: TetR/AcrR family transcriptional regulator [Actinomycetota bacterium]
MSVAKPVTPTRDRILETTAELFRRHGYVGTGLKQIVADANAPFGSIYHHFPGGKEQLGAEVIRSSGLMYQLLVTGVLDAAPDIVTGVRDCFTAAAAVLEATDYQDACPIETVALEVASTNEVLRQACADVFDGWIAAGLDRHEAAGLDRDTARALTVLFISTLEGAFVLCRAKRDTEALEVAAVYVSRVVEHTLNAHGLR